MKTETILPMAAQADVKTEERLPNLMLVRGKYWYFRHQDVQIPMGKVAGEYGSDGFLARHAQLMHLFRLDYPDERNVYFIGWEGGPVKIGVAGEPEVRRTTLQTACPYTLRVEALTTGGVHTERDYHSRFSAHRLRNEWFERSPEIQAEIDRLNTIPSQTPWE